MTHDTFRIAIDGHAHKIIVNVHSKVDVYLKIRDVNLKFRHMYLHCCIVGYIQISTWLPEDKIKLSGAVLEQIIT